MQPAGAPATGESGQAQLWVLRDGDPAAVRVVTGLDDDSFTEITDGDLKPGDPIIISEQRATRAGQLHVPIPRC